MEDWYLDESHRCTEEWEDLEIEQYINWDHTSVDGLTTMQVERPSNNGVSAETARHPIEVAVPVCYFNGTGFEQTLPFGSAEGLPMDAQVVGIAGAGGFSNITGLSLTTDAWFVDGAPSPYTPPTYDAQSQLSSHLQAQSIFTPDLQWQTQEQQQPGSTIQVLHGQGIQPQNHPQVYQQTVTPITQEICSPPQQAQFELTEQELQKAHYQLLQVHPSLFASYATPLSPQQVSYRGSRFCA
ncbi:hypothetical protein BC939DRAFT_44218 [Gamsiella multidivaricata]|uniref:uncharacterized protein n=1 Tax=Gamsiella multidivaricata TaxID=101098 RepID=UPI00221FAE5C|nr:uncharacterized protein BC939DRAFT_44218 [Gamsiella multidivaricata]KAI7816461.1 hypothetical protein BC939DRAFT_44218 [Gamsiella multidivaricata]